MTRYLTFLTTSVALKDCYWCRPNAEFGDECSLSWRYGWCGSLDDISNEPTFRFSCLGRRLLRQQLYEKVVYLYRFALKMFKEQSVVDLLKFGTSLVALKSLVVTVSVVVCWDGLGIIYMWLQCSAVKWGEVRVVEIWEYLVEVWEGGDMGWSDVKWYYRRSENHGMKVR